MFLFVLSLLLSQLFFFSEAGKKRSFMDLVFLTFSITLLFLQDVQHVRKGAVCGQIVFCTIPKISMGELLLLTYFWSMDMTREKTARMMSVNVNLVWRVFWRLEDVCSLDIDRNPFIPFGRTAVVKCDESKFNHKAKVRKREIWSNESLVE